MTCMFCPNPYLQDSVLCSDCMNELRLSLMETAMEEENTTDLDKYCLSKVDNNGDIEGVSVTYRYESEMKVIAKDKTNGSWIIEDYTSITEYCKYFHEKIYPYNKWIDLTNVENATRNQIVFGINNFKK